MSLTREDKEAAARIRLTALAAKFVERSAGDLDAMRALLGRLAAGELLAFTEMRHLAHRLCGTGATLGFDTLADCANRIELLCESAATMPAADADVVLQLGTSVDALGVELARLKGT